MLARTADNSAVLTISVTKKKDDTKSSFFRGGAKRIRTAGLLVANEALYQLSHNPKSILIIYHSLAFVNDFFNLFQKNLF